MSCQESWNRLGLAFQSSFSEETSISFATEGKVHSARAETMLILRALFLKDQFLRSLTVISHYILYFCCVVGMSFRLSINLRRFFNLSGVISTISKKFWLPRGHMLDGKGKLITMNFMQLVQFFNSAPLSPRCDSLCAAIAQSSKFRDN